jgi:flagellar motor protein MotB
MSRETRKVLAASRRNLRNEAKRSTELWIYSFADMYMIITVFFIAMAALYAAKSKKDERQPAAVAPPSAGQGTAVAQSLLAVEFAKGEALLGEGAKDSLGALLPLVKASASAYVDVEGYADSVPLSRGSPYSSNLHLSQARALAVAEWFIGQGVPPARVRTSAHGDGRSFLGRGAKTDRRVVVKLYSRGTP